MDGISFAEKLTDPMELVNGTSMYMCFDRPVELL
jgi:hypothetical protein